ncbi:MAG: DNA primase [Oscillospiraceae bacterium]|jgi:DNA primase|nr:DNA primase [Oscillospiraceae bacterium]
MARIPDSFIAALKERVDIRDVISTEVELKRGGRTWVGLCPFHNERSPSFHVWEDHFYCFGCQAGGDAISYIMKKENLGYVDAIEELAGRYGLTVPKEGQEDALSRLRLRILSANRAAARFFHAQLRIQAPDGRQYWNAENPGYQYWKKRRLSDEIIVHFGLGYAPAGWDALRSHLLGEGFSLEELVAANLVIKHERDGRISYYDAFRNRVMVPILDLRGNVIAFGGRVLDDSKPKYVNTSDTPVYRKGNDLFALNFAKNGKTKKLILCEGYMDAIALHAHGFTQAVACLGTALTDRQASLLSRYAEEITLCYDADEAGRNAAKKALAVLEKTQIKTRVIQLDGGKDPDEILNTHGPEKFRALLENTSNDIEFKLLTAREGFDLTATAGKQDYLRRAAQILSYQDAITADLYSSRLAEELEVRKESLLAMIQSHRAARKKKSERDFEQFTPPVMPKNKVSLDRTRAEFPAEAAAEEKIIGTLVAHPDVYLTVGGILNTAHFATTLNRRLLEGLLPRLAEGVEVEIPYLHEIFNEAELSELARMQEEALRMTNPAKLCQDGIEKLRQLFEKREQLRTVFSDDTQFREAFRRNGRLPGAS